MSSAKKQKTDYSINLAANRSKDFVDKIEFCNDLKSVLPRQVIFCTRTHSQATQILKEFQKTEYATRYTAIVVASRDRLCVNSEIIEKTGDINENCTDLLKAKSQCPYYNESKKTALTEFITNIKNTKSSFDIERVIETAINHSVCPYFGVRKVASACEVVFFNFSYL